MVGFHEFGRVSTVGRAATVLEACDKISCEDIADCTSLRVCSRQLPGGFIPHDDDVDIECYEDGTRGNVIRSTVHRK